MIGRRFIYKNQVKGQPLWNWMYDFNYEPAYPKIPLKSTRVKGQKMQSAPMVQTRKTPDRHGTIIANRNGRK